MKITIFKHLITCLIDGYISASSGKILEWAPYTKYSLAMQRTASGNLYVAALSGVSGGVPPSHTSGKSTDGSVEWIFIGEAKNRKSPGSSLYLGIGSEGAWKNEILGDDVTEFDNSRILASTKSFLKLEKNNFSIGVKRINWATNVVYQPWPNEESYVIAAGKIYRCIDNNEGVVSTVSPTGSSILNVELADGYVWKYLGDVTTTLDEDFGITDSFPLKELTKNDGSNRWTVQNSALDGSISSFTLLQQTGIFTTPAYTFTGPGTLASTRADLRVNGSIRRVVVTASGSGYTRNSRLIVKNNSAPGINGNVSVTLTGGAVTALGVVTAGSGYTSGAVAFIDGDGTGATATIQTTGGFITGATITSPGSNYTTANVVIVPGTSGAIFSPVLAPKGGHGKNIIKELPCNYLLVSRRINGLDFGIVENTQFRQISLVSGISGGFRLVGPAHGSPGGKEAANLTEARVIYLNHIPPVTHSDAQDELIKIGLKVD